MTIEQMEQAESRALQRLVQAEVAKERARELEARRRERQQQELQKQVEQATADFEKSLAVLKSRLSAIASEQTKWRRRFDAVLSELDALSESQPTIQQEIKSIIQEVEAAVYRARQKGALIASDTQTHFDAIGGGDPALWPFPADVSNVRHGASNTIANNLARDICPDRCYRPDLTIDSRRRV